MAKTGLQITADMSEGVRAEAFLTQYLTEMATPAYTRTVIKTTHSVFADMFNAEISKHARLNPGAYHHVYEYSPQGDGYQDIGKTHKRLWDHVIQYRGGTGNFTWTWRAAQQYNPTYRQRRVSRMGWDAIRALSEEDFDRLTAKPRTRHKYTWKAPMLEHGIIANVYPRDGKKFLMVPTGGSKALFLRHVQSDSQQIGATRGNFTELWTRFWGAEVPKRWDDVLGRQIEADAARRMKLGLVAGGRTRVRTFRATAITNLSTARAHGKKQAIDAMRQHRRSVSSMDRLQGAFK